MVRQYQRQYGEPYQRQYDQGITLPNMPQSAAPERMAQGIANDAAKMASELDATAEKLYNNRFESAARQMVQEVYMKHPSNPEALRNEFNAAFEGLTKDASPFMVDELRAKFDILTTGYITKAAETKIKLNTDALKETGLTVMNQALNSIEHSAADMLSPNSQVAYDASRRMQYDLLKYEDMLNQKDELGNPLYSAEQRVKYREQAKQNIMLSGLKRWADEQPDKAAALEQIKSGQKKFTFYDANGEVSDIIDPTKEMSVHDFDKLVGHIAQGIGSQLKQVQKQQGIERVGSVLNGDLFFDPKDTQDKKSVNDYYAEVIQPQLDSPELTPNQKAQMNAEYVLKTGVMPSQLESFIRTHVRYGDPEQRAYTAEIVSEIANSNPLILKLKDPDISYAVQFSDLVQNGATPEHAVEILDQQFAPDQKEIRSKRETEFKALGIDPRVEISEMYTSKFLGVRGRRKELTEIPNISDTMLTEYRSIFEQEYLLSGDENIARERTKQRVNKVFGLSEVTGTSRIVMYPPEKFYEVDGVNNSWIREQMLSTAKTFSPDVADEDVFIANDPLTAQEAKTNTPSYPVMIRGQNGFEYLRDQETGDIVRFLPDRKPVIDRKNMELRESQQRQADLKSARERAIEMLVEQRSEDIATIGYLPTIDSSLIDSKALASINAAIEKGMIKAHVAGKKGLVPEVPGIETLPSID